MVRRNLNIALIILVVIIYSGLFFRLFQPTTNSVEEVPSDLSFDRKIENTITKPDTFELHLNKRDPFLDKMKTSYKAEASAPRVLKKKTINNVISIPLIWPDVQYLGFLLSKNETKTVVLRIDKLIVRLNKGEEASGIKLQRIFKDSVEITMKNQRKIIKN